MEDREIVSLLWNRDERAIEETEAKYAPYLRKIAWNILGDREDSREVVNDTCLKAWNSIPPQRPENLAAYLGRIARQEAIDIFRKRKSGKRRESEYTLSLSELEECVTRGDETTQAVDARLLGEAIGDFLRTLPPETADMFVMRYWYADSIRDIALRLGSSQARVKSSLHRTRLALKNYLSQEGFLT